MFEVIFEVHPQASRWDAYLTIAKSLTPHLEQVDGFQSNVRYKSLTRPGWLVSISDWEDEKALVRWRVEMKHHHAQAKGREHIFEDYHLRIGQVLRDSKNDEDTSSDERGESLDPPAFESTKVADAKVVTLMGISLNGGSNKIDVEEIEKRVKMGSYPGLVSWDIFEAILTPGDFLLLCSWETMHAAESSVLTVEGQRCKRIRYVGVVRDYGMFDRREAPQYYPEVAKKEM